MQNILKPILIILGLVALGALVYVFAIKGKPLPEITRTTTSGVTTSASEPLAPSVAVDVAEFQRFLAELNAINLNTQVFQKEQFPMLIDHTQTALIKLDETKAIAPLGKMNPFEALDGMPAMMFSPTSTSVVIPPRNR